LFQIVNWRRCNTTHYAVPYGITNQVSHTKEVNSMKLKLTKKLGMLLLGIWLVMSGLLQVFSIPIPSIDMILALLAIAAGASILLGK